jgi:hypothetical protein
LIWKDMLFNAGTSWGVTSIHILCIRRFVWTTSSESNRSPMGVCSLRVQGVDTRPGGGQEGGCRGRGGDDTRRGVFQRRGVMSSPRRVIRRREHPSVAEMLHCRVRDTEKLAAIQTQETASLRRDGRIARCVHAANQNRSECVPVSERVRISSPVVV